MVRDESSSTESTSTSTSPSTYLTDAAVDGHQLSDDAWRHIPARDTMPIPAPAELWGRVRAIIEEQLTQRQREVVELYFLRGMDQATVATLLGISQQSVSEHLFGKTRDGAQVGGVIRKLRKLCARQGIMPATRHRVAAVDDDAWQLEMAD